MYNHPPELLRDVDRLICEDKDALTQEEFHYKWDWYLTQEVEEVDSV